VLRFDSTAAPSPTLQRQVIRQGAGPKIAKGDLLVLDYVGQIWRGKVFDNSYDRHTASAVQIGIGSALAGWDTGLVGLTVGSRVMLTVPPSFAYGKSGNSAAGIKPTDTLVFVLDVGRSYDARSTADPAATLQPNPAKAPVVLGSLQAGPTITIPTGLPAPSRKSTYLLARGHGATLTDGTAVVQYQGVNWLGAVAGSTWQNGAPTSVPVGSASDATGGLFDTLAGVPIGSRVLIVAPAAHGQVPAPNSAAVVVDVIAQVTTARAMYSG
jgi:peptidylprolyl isomerase